MSQIRKRSSRKQNFSANHEGKHKSINGKRPEQAKQVRLRTIIGMIRGNTSRKRPCEQSEQWLDNEILFPSTLGCQLVDSTVILEALIEGFLVRTETRSKLKETRTSLVGFSGEDAEINYPPIEKLVLALVHATRRLRRYFQGHAIKVITDKPISQILNNREATRRLAKWGIKLEAYGIIYSPRNAIKGQVLTDFLAETMAEDSSIQVKASGPNDTLKGGKRREGAAGRFKNSNKNKGQKMSAFVDLKLVVSQVEGSYKAKSEKTKKYKGKALEIIRSFNNFQIRNIPREYNKKTNALSKLAAVQCEGLTKGVLIEELNERSVDTVRSQCNH
ncbi:reverse transcriptase domain-containing protein [Tanacetum coccineum]